MEPLAVKPASISICGTCVVFPEPVSPMRTELWLLLTISTTSLRISQQGNLLRVARISKKRFEYFCPDSLLTSPCFGSRYPPPAGLRRQAGLRLRLGGCRFPDGAAMGREAGLRRQAGLRLRLGGCRFPDGAAMAEFRAAALWAGRRGLQG
mmetsp:Transcript_10236/g.35857  ORF Transcript_10236/g.35857 Transcript_10236/m.35857 type:complete len:151 (-) Transcript_10236:7-459(-)